MSVAAQSGGGFRFGEPAPVPLPGSGGAVDAAPDGRLLVIRRTGERVANPFHLVTHWRALLNED